MYQFESTPILPHYNKTRVVVKKKVADIRLGDKTVPLEKTVYDEYVDNDKLHNEGVVITYSE